MKTEQFIQRLKPFPTTASNNEVKAIEQLIERYPWCGIARQLFLEVLSQNNDGRFSDYAPKTVVYVVHREQLYYRLQLLKTQPTAQKKEKAETIKEDDVLLIEEGTVIEEKKLIEDENSTKEEDLIEGGNLIEVDTLVEEQTSVEEEASTEIKTLVEEQTPVEETLVEEETSTEIKALVEEQTPIKEETLIAPPQPAITTKLKATFSAPSDYFAGEEIEVNVATDPIARFIVERPQIRPLASSLMGIELPNQIEQTAPPKKFEDIVTETLAKIYESQGLVSLAQATYEKLSLLEPKKSAYFAARIQNLKFKSNN
ncbi:MAG: hypothetical protein FWH23_00960 [Bacteroidales bacterium]|nr:hypothetical protein [Bacteroidales bacterium]MCL2133142.1 hypothetical protein [Bacteroidales bacterium]